MSKMTNSIYRLETLITLLGGEGTTINRLSKFMDVSKNVIYDDLLSIMKDKNSRLMILTYDEDYEDDFLSDETEAGGQSASLFARDIKTGKYDDVEIFVSTPYSNKIEVVLTAEEMDALQDFSDQNVGGGSAGGLSYLVKNSNSNYTERDIELSNYLIETMEDGDSLTITYLPHKNGASPFTKTIRPIRIVHNINDNLVYVCDHEGNFYRFDCIKDYRPSDEKLEISPDIDMKKFDKMWGVILSEDYTHVKLKIFDEVNVIERVKKDLGNKANENTFHYYEEEGYAIYEDDVVGVGSFMSWVYSYGSSVVLLSPDELVKRVVDSIKIRKEYYG